MEEPCDTRSKCPTSEYLLMMIFKTESIRYFLISIAMLLLGMLFYAFYNKLIIIRLPVRRGALFERRSAFRKQIPLWHFTGTSFVKDDKELIFSANTQSTLQDIVASWLSYVDEEHGLPQKASVQAVMMDAQKNTCYISFNKSPFNENQSTFCKLMFLEGLLRTLKSSSIQLKKVQFLVHHKPLHDRDLDFSHAWTINGYTS